MVGVFYRIGSTKSEQIIFTWRVAHAEHLRKCASFAIFQIQFYSHLQNDSTSDRDNTIFMGSNSIFNRTKLNYGALKTPRINDIFCNA